MFLLCFSWALLCCTNRYTGDKMHFKQNLLQLARDWRVANYKNHILDIFISILIILYSYHHIHNIWTFEYILVNTITMRYTGHDWPHFAMFPVTCHVSRDQRRTDTCLGWRQEPGEPEALSGGNLGNCHTTRLTHKPWSLTCFMCTRIFVMSLATFNPYPLNKPCVNWTTFLHRRYKLEIIVGDQ